MTEENKIEKIVRPTEKTLDDEISKIATAMGVPKDQVVRTAIKNLTGKTKPDKVDKFMSLYEKTKDMPIGNTSGGNGVPSIQEILMYKMLGGIDKEEKKSDGLDMEKMLSFQLLKSMFAPNPMEMMMYMNMSKGNNDNSDKSSEIFREMMSQQQQSQSTLMAAIFGKERIDSSTKISEIERRTSEQQSQAKLDFAQNVVPTLMNLEHKIENIEKGSGGRSVVDELQEYTAFQAAMKEFAKEHGMVEKGSDGKLDWGGIAQQIMGLGKEAVSKIPASAPQPRQVQPIQTQSKTIPKPIKTIPKPTTKTFTEPMMSKNVKPKNK